MVSNPARLRTWERATELGISVIDRYDQDDPQAAQRVAALACRMAPLSPSQLSCISALLKRLERSPRRGGLGGLLLGNPQEAFQHCSGGLVEVRQHGQQAQRQRCLCRACAAEASKQLSLFPIHDD